MQIALAVVTLALVITVLTAGEAIDYYKILGVKKNANEKTLKKVRNLLYTCFSR